jgi:hypothetical protein
MRARTRADVLNSREEAERHHRLTPNQEYLVLGVHIDTIRIINDSGEPVLYSKYLFDITDCRIPPGWQFEEFTGEAEYYLEPEKASAPGFYEDYFNSDGDLQAQKNARIVLHNILKEILIWSDEDARVIVQCDLARLNAKEAR